MRETKADLDELQALLDRSDAAGGEHLRSIFDVGHRIAAADLVAELDGIFEMHLATTSSGGVPLIADGVAKPGDPASAMFAEYEAVLRELYVGICGSGWNEWYDEQRRTRDSHAGFIGWLEPRLLFAKR